MRVSSGSGGPLVIMTFGGPLRITPGGLVTTVESYFTWVVIPMLAPRLITSLLGVFSV
jgi:hypothetical protein